MLQLRYGSESEHATVRAEVVQQLQERAEHYCEYVTEPFNSFEEYVSLMAKNQTWGDHVTLQAAADLYQRCVCLVTSHPEAAYVEVQPRGAGAGAKPLWLSYWDQLHYNSLAPVS